MATPTPKLLPPEESGSRILLEIWREFTKDELQDKGEELALAEMQSDEIERERRESQSDYAKKLKDLRGRISQLSKQIQTKGAQRPTWCVVMFHRPAQGKKEIYRSDTGELVDIQEMTDTERQQKLFPEEK
jgi:hypothetical protein